MKIQPKFSFNCYNKLYKKTMRMTFMQVKCLLSARWTTNGNNKTGDGVVEEDAVARLFNCC